MKRKTHLTERKLHPVTVFSTQKKMKIENNVETLIATQMFTFS